MAQLLDAYSDIAPTHGLGDADGDDFLPSAQHHYANDAHPPPPPPLLNDTTLDPILRALTGLDWPNLLRTFALCLLFLLMLRQLYTWRQQANAQRRRRAKRD